MTEDKAQRALEAIEVAQSTGKIKKGINEATKALERGTAKLVAYAKDVQPKEITLHLPVLAKEKGVPCFEVNTKEELGVAAGIGLPASAVAVINVGDAKKLVDSLKKEEAEPAPAEKKEEKKQEEKPAGKKEKPEIKEDKAEDKTENKEGLKEEAPAEKETAEKNEAEAEKKE